MTSPSFPAETLTSNTERRLAMRRLCWLFLGCYFLLWTVLPWLVDQDEPADSQQVLGAARVLAWMYPEYSPLAVWIAHPLATTFPAAKRATYALGALYVGVMLSLAWLVARDMLDRRRAILAVLFITCCTYYTNRLHFCGENMALLATTAGAVYCLWRALRNNALGWWAATGALWGAGLLANPLMLVTICCGLTAAWTMEPRRNRPPLSAFALALATALVVIAPSALWAAEHDLLEMHRLVTDFGETLPFLARPRRAVDFLADQLLRLVPFLFLLGILLRTRKLQIVSAQSGSMPIPSLAARRFLAIHAWGPLILIAGLALLLGVNLQAQWGTAFLWLVPVWFVSTRRGARFASIDLEHVLVCLALTHVVMIVGYVLNW